MDLYTFVLILSVILGTTSAHYFPYWMYLAGGKLPSPKNLIFRYVAGTLCWFLPFSIWLATQGYTRFVLFGWIFLSVSGITVIALYLYDTRITAKDRKEMADLLERRRNAKEKGTN